MSRQVDLRELALRLGEQSITPVHGSLAHRARLYGDVPVARSHRRLIYEREQTHLFGRRTWERLTIELTDDSSYPDPRENDR